MHSHNDALVIWVREVIVSSTNPLNLCLGDVDVLLRPDYAETDLLPQAHIGPIFRTETIRARDSGIAYELNGEVLVKYFDSSHVVSVPM